MKQKISIALIHNNDVQRCSYLLPRLDQLQRDLSNYYVTNLFKISSQPNVSPLSLSFAVCREFSYWQLSRQWKKYCLVKPWPLWSDVIRPLKNVLRKYVFTSSKERIRLLKHGRIEMIVTAKHIRAWKKFVKKEDDFLICFEDDVVFKDDSIYKMIALIECLYKEIVINQGIYVDLAGGCTFEKLQVKQIESKRDAYFRYFAKPVTNTACCYVINKQVAEVFLLEIEQNPDFKVIGIDWLINQLFMKSETHLNCLCKHADPHLFDHGSVTGQYLDWRHSKTIKSK